MILVGNLTVTRLVLLVVAGVLLALESAALVWPRLLPLISPTMRVDGMRWVVWPAGFGLLGGHFWAPGWLRFDWAVAAGPYVLAVYGVALLAFDVLGPRVSVDAAFALMLASVVVGAVFWSQR